MKKLIAGVMALALLASCGNKKTGIDPFASLTNEVDSALHRADTLHRPKASEEPKPTEADESFDDFIITLLLMTSCNGNALSFRCPTTTVTSLQK